MYSFQETKYHNEAWLYFARDNGFAMITAPVSIIWLTPGYRVILR